MWAGSRTLELKPCTAAEREGEEKSLLLLTWQFCKAQTSFGGRKPDQCARENAKYRALEPLFRETSECICKLKSFTKVSPGLRYTANAGVGMMIIVMTIAIIGNIY